MTTASKRSLFDRLHGLMFGIACGIFLKYYLDQRWGDPRDSLMVGGW